jgi:hypothetical protein
MMNSSQSATRSASDGAGWRWFHLSNSSILLVQCIDRISLLLKQMVAQQRNKTHSFTLLN